MFSQLFWCQERARRASLSLPTCPLGHGDLEKKIVRPHRGGEQTLGKGIVRPQGYRDEFFEFVVAVGVPGGLQLCPQALEGWLVTPPPPTASALDFR